jgi:hypothetical protein
MLGRDDEVDPGSSSDVKATEHTLPKRMGVSLAMPGCAAWTITAGYGSLRSAAS